MTQVLRTIDNIKNLHDNEVEDYKLFYSKVAEEFNLEVVSVETNWFMKYNITERYRVRQRLLEFMQNYIALQNGVLRE